MTNAPIDSIYDLAIIGAGFCGTQLLLNILQQIEHPIKIALIEKGTAIAKGVAYSTADPFHLLNVSASKMSAFSNLPNHFYQWLVQRDAAWRKLNPAYVNLKCLPESYMPRMVYGSYLEELWQETLCLAHRKKCAISIFKETAENIAELPNRLLSIQLSSGRRLCCQIGVLATGVFPNREYAPRLTKNYIANVWEVKPSFEFARHIVVIGSGLTMLDAVATLLRGGYTGHVTAISRTGKLPEKHSMQACQHPPFIDMQSPPLTACALLKIVRQAAAAAKQHTGTWQGAIDALRPITVALWQQLDLIEKKKIQRFLFSQWNHHRHRAPKEALQKIAALQDRFTLLAGSVEAVQPFGNAGLAVLRRGQAPLAADCVINCAGPDFNIERSHAPLFQNLLRQKLISGHPLGWGIAADGHFRVSDAPLFAVGQLLMGERFESIAVPDLRLQCEELAKHLLSLL